MAFNPANFNGPIPGEGLTNPPGSAPYQNPPQFTHLDDLLESLWEKFTDPKAAVKLYAMLKGGLPAEALARTILFGAFSHGICTVDLAMLALPTVIKQVVAVGHLLGVKNIKIRNPDVNQTKFLAQCASLIDENGGDPEPDDQVNSVTGAPKSAIFTGLGV